ncbi:MAG: type II toxin-antitoxin system PemK/MazF family toxin [Pleurocapsa sp. SU_5_0]|nr:type II toxin-antitoxin system PemK/MazF family toxin [Pleurocapsa sp. SU_5_0]NJO96495.1 type II toxin-antitoxin system PemK/MazF family toxin [Pleurocapsa sp. CRU_1_2]NJR46638.1 type II toxin-antitoxin system PemK/MazF family toxin [Hyellaceae cyanobacterium CSU_1_1]
MSSEPKRGEVWLVNLDPTIGAEIQKTRPVVVISSDFIGKLPLKLVVPITDWKESFELNIWHIKLEPSTQNGLSKISATDVLQTRSVDKRRFIKQLGKISTSELSDLTCALAAIVEHS